MTVEQSSEEVTIESLPVHVLRSKLKEKGIKFRPKDKKKDLIKMLQSGETIHKPEPKKQAPHLGDDKVEPALPIVPKEIRGQLEELAGRGLTWDIDEGAGCINFERDLKTCANLDQPAKNILRTAREAFGKALPIETKVIRDIGK